MGQVKISLTDEQLTFLSQHQQYGFKDRSELVRAALRMYEAEVQRKALERSADLYSQVYETDSEAQAWLTDSLQDWPT